MENNNQLVERKSWFKRNWIWALPVGGCLTVIIVTIILMGVGIFAFKDSIQAGIDTQKELIDQALLDAQQNQEVVSILGEPIEINGLGEYSTSIYNSTKTIISATPIKGPNGEATIHLTNVTENGKSENETYLVVIDDTRQEIDLNEN